MGDASVDVFTIPMVEFDCLGGQKQLHKMGPAATSKFSSLIFRYFGLFEKNRFSQKIIIIFAMIYGRVDRWFYGWSSPIFAHICSTPCEHTIITSSFLRHLGERSHIIIMLGKCVCRLGFWKNQSSRKPHTQLFFCMCFCNSSQFSWVVITHAILEKAEKKGFMITIKETFRGLKYGLWKNTQYFDNCPPTRKLFLRF